jgi:sugar lactone lactonase YvrE
MKITSLLNQSTITTTICAGAVMLAAAGASAQNLYVDAGSSGSADIYQITPGGVQTPVATGMNYPDAIAFDSQGNLFVANTALNNGQQGNITEVKAGGGTTVFASGLDPEGLAFNKAGDLFECEYRTGVINEFTPLGVETPFATGLANPIAMAFDNFGNLFVGAGYGAGGGYIEEITPGGVASTFASGLTFPQGIAFNSIGDMFVSENSTGIIYEYTAGGARSTFATLSQTDLNGIAFNSTGDLFVSGGHSDSIIEITPDGTPSTFVSGLSFTPQNLAFQGLALPVPEPSTLALLGMGASAVALRLRRKK